MTKKELIDEYAQTELDTINGLSSEDALEVLIDYAEEHFLHKLRGKKRSEIINGFVKFWIEVESEYLDVGDPFDEDAAATITRQLSKLSKQKLIDKVDKMDPKVRGKVKKRREYMDKIINCDPVWASLRLKPGTKKDLIDFYVKGQLDLLSLNDRIDLAKEHFLHNLRGKKRSEIKKMYFKSWLDSVIEDEDDEYEVLESEASLRFRKMGARLSKKELVEKIHYLKVEVPKIRDAMEEADWPEQLTNLEENIMLSVMEEDSPE